MANRQQQSDTGPESLVAIIVAAHRVGNRELEITMRRQLEDRFDIRLRFIERKDSKGEPHAYGNS